MPGSRLGRDAAESFKEYATVPTLQVPESSFMEPSFAPRPSKNTIPIIS